jgi:hypothetical protein
MLRGIVSNGKVILDDPSLLIEGAPLRITQQPRKAKAARPAAKPSPKTTSLSDLAFDGCPPDMSQQHDHYASGAPKKVRRAKVKKA